MRSRVFFLLFAALGVGILVSLVLPSWALVALLGCVLVVMGLCGCKKF